MPLTCGSSTTADLLAEVNKNTDARGFLALKIFQAPTAGELTEIQTRTADGGQLYQVRKAAGGGLATIYSDEGGTTTIPQNGSSNRSDGAGIVSFYINSGSFYIESGGAASNFNTLGTAAIADLTESTTDTTAGRALKVRDGGLLSPSLSSEKVIIGDFLAVVETLPTGIYSVFKPDLTANIPTGLNDRAVVTVRQYNFSDTYVTLIDNRGLELSAVRWNGTWYDWTTKVNNQNFSSYFDSDYNAKVGSVNFTPTLFGQDVAGDYTANIATGSVVKIGNLVTVFVSFQDIVTNSAGSGNLRVGGLPYPSSFNQSMFYSCVSSVDIQNMSSLSDLSAPVVKVPRGTSEAVIIDQSAPDSDGDYALVQIENFVRQSPQTTRFGFTVQYLTD